MGVAATFMAPYILTSYPCASFLHTDGSSCDIHGARGWGKTHSNLFISIKVVTPLTLNGTRSNLPLAGTPLLRVPLSCHNSVTRGAHDIHPVLMCRGACWLRQDRR